MQIDIRTIKKIRYPELETIMHQYPNPEILLGKEIFWQEKRDGSNLGVWMTKFNNVKLRSRNMDSASNDFYKIFFLTEQSDSVRELIKDLRDQWHKNAVIFGELLMKGKSPTRTELHEKHEFIVFDIYDIDAGEFLPYVQVYQYCYQYKLPIVELYGTSKHLSVDSLMAWRDKMLNTAKEKGREGVVGKTFDGKRLYFKEKLDLPKIEKLPRSIEDGLPQLPELPESEILGALDKVLVDLGMSKFNNIKFAMPLFAKYVKIECDKHNCRCSAKLFPYYQKRLEELPKQEKLNDKFTRVARFKPLQDLGPDPKAKKAKNAFTVSEKGST